MNAEQTFTMDLGSAILNLRAAKTHLWELHREFTVDVDTAIEVERGLDSVIDLLQSDIALVRGWPRW